MKKAGKLAKRITFLASGEASFITRSEYLIDGHQCI